MKFIFALLLMPMAAVAADFDVRAFGAKGDGGAMDTAAIQRTIEASVESADWCRRPGDTNRFAEIR